jgi:hypothetical protein
VLSERAGLLEDANLDFTERPARFVVCLNQLRELYRASEPRGATSNEQNIHRNRFGVWRLGQYQSVQRERRLMAARQNAEGTIGH